MNIGINNNSDCFHVITQDSTHPSQNTKHNTFHDLTSTIMAFLSRQAKTKPKATTPQKIEQISNQWYTQHHNISNTKYKLHTNKHRRPIFFKNTPLHIQSPHKLGENLSPRQAPSSSGETHFSNSSGGSQINLSGKENQLICFQYCVLRMIIRIILSRNTSPKHGCAEVTELI